MFNAKSPRVNMVSGHVKTQLIAHDKEVPIWEQVRIACRTQGTPDETEARGLSELGYAQVLRLLAHGRLAEEVNHPLPRPGSATSLACL